MFLSLLEHVQLFAESEDCFFGRIAALLRGLATEPGPHLGVCLYLFCDGEVCAIVGGLILSRDDRNSSNRMRIDINLDGQAERRGTLSAAGQHHLPESTSLNFYVCLYSRPKVDGVSQ